MKLRRILVVIAAAVVMIASITACNAKPALKFRADGSFKIVQFTDTQDGPNLDPRTTAAMNKILDSEKPDLVIITGDCVDTGRCGNVDDLKKGIEAVGQPMELRRIPWAVTFGNHDRDNLGKIGISQDAMLGLYMKYPCNINKHSSKGVHGAGNANLLIEGSTSGRPVFGVWLIDSGAYAPGEIAGQKLGGYDWVHFTQVKWYYDTSVVLEKRHGKKIPSLLFMHIPVREHSDVMVEGKFTGEKNENSGASRINSGLFSAALERGDLLGMFVGHEHVNTLVGDLYGIKLGYSGNIGYATYGLPGKDDDNERNRLRGGRVFEILESTTSFATRYVTAASLK